MNASPYAQHPSLMEWGVAATFTLTGVTLFSKIPGGSLLSFFCGIFIMCFRYSFLKKRRTGTAINPPSKKAWSTLNLEKAERAFCEKIIGRRELIQSILSELNASTTLLKGKCKLSMEFSSPLGAGLPFCIDTISRELLKGDSAEWFTFEDEPLSLSQFEERLKKKCLEAEENIFIIKYQSLSPEIFSCIEEILLTGMYRLRYQAPGEKLSFETAIFFFIKEGQENQDIFLSVDHSLKIEPYHAKDLAALFLYEAHRACSQRGLQKKDYNPEWISEWVRISNQRKVKPSQDLPLKSILNEMKRELFFSIQLERKDLYKNSPKRMVS